MADFVVEVGAERTITLTLHPRTKRQPQRVGIEALEAIELYECHNALLTKRSRTHVRAAHVW